MNRLDRLFGILLHLRSRGLVSAAELAARLEVSPRTIYRDIETLSALGIPVYAERGREGGLRLLEGFFLPPIMFSQEEAISLVLALTLLRSLRAKAYAAALDSAEDKLLAAVSDRLRHLLSDAPKIVGFEQMPADIFHPERSNPNTEAEDEAREGLLATAFMQGLLEHRVVRIIYHTPYGSESRAYEIVPLGMFWDRGHWYLVGVDLQSADSQIRPWRTDRIVEMSTGELLGEHNYPFDVRGMLGRNWLEAAMDIWRQQAPVKIRMTPALADRMRQDWYYRYGHFEPDMDGQIVMTFGEDDPHMVIELVRWLGPDAELLSPTAWRSLLHDDLSRMLQAYQDEKAPPHESSEGEPTKRS